MRAAVIHGARDVRIENVPDPTIRQPTDALVRVVRACICGSDLWPYGSLPHSDTEQRIGHEFLGVVEDLGADVAGFARGDLVVAPFVWSDGTCEFCRKGLQTSCRHGGSWARDGIDGGQGEAVRVPQAQGTLVKLPVAADSALLPSLMILSDVFPTGYHCAVKAGVTPPHHRHGDRGRRRRPVCRSRGEAARAEQIILMGRHRERTDLGVEFGATDVVAERGEAGIEKVRGLTGGDGTPTVLECVGLAAAIDTALGVVRDGGVVSRVGAPQYSQVPMDFGPFLRNITRTGGVAPARAYIDQLLPDILDGRIEPGRVFDRTVGLDEVPDGYQAMADRKALKVLVTP